MIIPPHGTAPARFNAGAETGNVKAGGTAAIPRWQTVVALGAVALFYTLTAAGNLSETDDAYHFAHLVKNAALLDFSDPRLLGYHLLARGLWRLSDAAGVELPALQLLRALSVLGATACLWLTHRLLHRHLSLPSRPALLATALLACSYGYWRYAAEADVYLPAMALCAALLLALLHTPASGPRAAMLGAGGGAVVLFYQPSAIALFMAFPVLLWRRDGWRVALVYAASGCAVAGLGYLLAFAVYWPAPLSISELRRFMSQRSEEFMVPPLSWWAVKVSVLRSVAALGHDIVSANWVFGLHGAEAVVQRLFSNNVIEEELFLARQSRWLSRAGLLTLPAVAATAAWAVWLARPWTLPWRLGGALPAIWLWVGLTGLVIGRLNPAGTEAWIVFLLPLGLLFGALVVGPAWTRGGGRALCLLLAALAAHNAIGIAMVASERSDLHQVRGEWVLRQAQSNDLLLVVDSIDLAECLRYRSPAQVLMVKGFALPVLVSALAGDEQAEVYSRGRKFAGVAVQRAAREALARGGRVIAVVPHPRGPVEALDAPDAPAARELHRSSDGASTLLLAGPPRTAEALR